MDYTLLQKDFYQRSTAIVAQDLLGKLLIHDTGQTKRVGRIIETEAYTGADDPASHAYRGKTKRNQPMFGPVGHAYVYFTYGKHFCLNVVAKDNNQEAGAVLIRAIEPLESIDLMCKMRGRADNIANGPGKLTQALSIALPLNGHDVTQPEQLYIAKDQYVLDVKKINRTSRIGIRVAKNILWRFCYV